jgi:hypothetical protein
MKKTKRYFFGFALAAGLFLMGSLLHSRGSVAKGAYSTPVTVMNTTANSVPSSPAVPGTPFLQELSNSGSSRQAFGPSNGNAFAISAMTFTNFNNAQELVRIFQPTLSSAFTCGGASIVGGGQGVRLLLQPGQTYQLTFPTPMVMTPSNGLLCGAADFGNTDGNVYISVVGYSN